MVDGEAGRQVLLYRCENENDKKVKHKLNRAK